MIRKAFRPTSRSGRHAVSSRSAACLAAALAQACPLYVTDHAGFCFHEIDVLGGWISEVVVLFILDAAALMVLLLVSAKEVNRT
jgi:hypothetical protein